MSKAIRSVITCDLEGRIETCNAGAEELFGYSADELIGKRRVSIFSPGLVVLGHVGGWLAEAVKTGEFRTRTVFRRKDGTPFAADIRITPTRRQDGRQIGYCGVTVPAPDVPPEEAMPRIGWGTRIFAGLVITRAPFLTATLVPVLAAAGWVAARSAGPFPWATFALVMVGALALHVAANTFNDYFDWTSGTDPGNNDYFLPFSGGSRAIELGLIRPGGVFAIGAVALAIAALAGALLVPRVGTGVLVFGAVGALSGFFYTAPPLRLAARRGLGELFVGLNFGPLLFAGTAFCLTGRFDPMHLVAGIPLGLLTAAILWINEFPDAESDARAGKNHLVVTLGKSAARWGYLALLVAAFGGVVAGVVGQLFPPLALLALIAAPLAVYSTAVLFRHHSERSLIRANAATIQLHLAAGLLFAAGLFWG